VTKYKKFQYRSFLRLEYTDKNENQIFRIYKEIQSGAVEGLPGKCANISPYMRRPVVIYDFVTTYSILNFLIYEEN
jgi:hypothetical protein